MSKNFYMAVTIEQDNNASVCAERTKEQQRYYAFLVKVSEGDNLLSRLGSIGGLLHAHLYPTKQRAEEIVRAWNSQYKANGTYLFDKPSF